jgi:cysteine desulfurase
MRTAYFDNNATTPVLPGILEAMLPYFCEKFGNPSAIYRRGVAAREAVEHAREAVARLLGCREGEVVFTSGGTEADNLAIFGVATPGGHIIAAPIEHGAVLNACRHLEHMGCPVTWLHADAQGLIDPEEVRRALRPNTKLISVMMANNETGVLQPVERVGQIARAANVLFHTDAVQAAGKIPIAVERIGCDLLSISGHKFHAPQGIGALYVRRGTLLMAVAQGGHQERGRRAGTENVPGIVGLGRACELALHGLADGSIERIRSLRDRFEAGALASVEAIEINGGGAPRVANTSNVFFRSIPGVALAVALDRAGIAASAGAACSSGAGEPSHVLVAMGLGETRARCSLRFSLGKQTEAADVDYLLSVLPEMVGRLRRESLLAARRP